MIHRSVKLKICVVVYRADGQDLSVLGTPATVYQSTVLHLGTCGGPKDNTYCHARYPGQSNLVPIIAHRGLYSTLNLSWSSTPRHILSYLLSSLSVQTTLCTSTYSIQYSRRSALHTPHNAMLTDPTTTQRRR
ncbi:uncharacterized protein EURHEDRAFT_288749 [Aspergillus ruber CBS 135680]|uniref:Uncharacterized protein n=1 Tax=Aspergillus ruber (strain CBS 135680) TaxID=1388766 RepID=A0A017S0L1_ASPRC|nr:uncharacterized protein EURHEDRAFT_288749 [Aspergillus ruber CBS 135680]EYE90538.1 hypothetical protein EURHEDRAFT_288749 [Aspergillus ruber CBS 135680]